jgi:hypothetical protein
MKWPTFGNGTLNDKGHQQQAEGGKPSREADNEEQRQNNLCGGGREGKDARCRKWVWAARQMQLELRGEQQHRDIVQLQKAVPLVDA